MSLYTCSCPIADGRDTLCMFLPMCMFMPNSLWSRQLVHVHPCARVHAQLLMFLTPCACSSRAEIHTQLCIITAISTCSHVQLRIFMALCAYSCHFAHVHAKACPCYITVRMFMPNIHIHATLHMFMPNLALVILLCACSCPISYVLDTLCMYIPSCASSRKYARVYMCLCAYSSHLALFMSLCACSCTIAHVLDRLCMFIPS